MRKAVTRDLPALPKGRLQERLSSKITGIPPGKMQIVSEESMRRLRDWKSTKTGGILGVGMELGDLMG